MWKLFALTLLVSCATSYQPKGFTGGYTDQRLSKDMYRVIFTGNGYTGQDTVQDYLLKRCAELTLQNGYTHFVVIGQNSSTDTNFIGNHSASAYGNQVYGQSNVYSVNKHTSGATIKMLNNPDERMAAYDALVIFGGPYRATASE